MARIAFNNFFSLVLAKGKLTVRQRRQVESIQKIIEGDSHAAEAVKRLIIRRYERSNGRIAGAIDWSAILEWFLANIGPLLPIILKLIAIFA